MGKRVAGMCFVKVDGEQLEVKGSLEATIGEVVRETVSSTKGAVGFKETNRVPSVKVTAIFMPDFPIDTLINGTDMTITSEFANGKVHTLSGAYLVGEPTAKGEDGEVDLEFEGTKGIWQ
ncbi:MULTISPECIES: phage tail tube protein [Caballeronia]|uniref:Phage tail tube protein n=1 Tax=Caballeronia cordobensis TaxID=1353886 RepID=A0A158FNK7_CABCO|nr:phage tail tube protein [Caballeronia cordobensis]SAL20720.1 Phage tail tube protein [Caballeronia cordobensis]